jgi:outer membrane immunogenic protein
MKRVFLAGVALAALVGSATAADIPRRVERAAPAPAPYVAPVYNWTGFYLGINGGWGWGTGSFNGTPATGDLTGSGGLIGGTLGYNWQFGQAVWGLETDIGWSGIKGDGACRGFSDCEVRNDWLGTARVRLGWAADRWMPYVTGGLAYGGLKAEVNGHGESDTNAGWTVGGGLEVALAQPWTAKLEYLYVDLGDINCNSRCGGNSPDKVDFHSHIVRAGLNYRF